MEARSRIRNASVAPRKARLIADLVRNQYVEDALSQLRFTHKTASPIIYKLIQSAAANAQYQDPNIDIAELYIKEIRVDEGVTREVDTAPRTGYGKSDPKTQQPYHRRRG